MCVRAHHAVAVQRAAVVVLAVLVLPVRDVADQRAERHGADQHRGQVGRHVVARLETTDRYTLTLCTLSDR